MLTILLVEENNELRKKIKDMLKKDYRVLEAENGMNAVEITDKENISLYIFNSSIPFLSTKDFLKRCMNPFFCPVLFYSSTSEESDDIYNLSTNLTHFDHHIKYHVNRYYGESSHDRYFQFETLICDYYTKKVFIDEEELSLSPKEFKLFTFLLTQEKRIYSREELLNQVWGYDFSGSSRTVDTHIKSLRSKLRDYNSLILTIWGKGYKMNIPFK